jgi:hypothetical protein
VKSRKKLKECRTLSSKIQILRRFFFEVKFRACESFQLMDLPKGYQYDNVFIILVSKKHIKCISVDELKNGKEITSTSTKYLGARKEFDLEKKVIIDFCNFAVQFFENV